MSDKPKPGKDKDLRYLRQAIEETDQLFGCLSTLAEQQLEGQQISSVTEAMLLVLDQLDLLDQMLSNSAESPAVAIELNRRVRGIVSFQLTQSAGNVFHPIIVEVVQALGRQLRALLIVKEIRVPL